MRLTRKWSFVAQEAKRLAALGLSEREIAKRLNVAKSTITRAKKRGDLDVVIDKTDVRADLVTPDQRQAPAAWAKAVREEYQLDSSDEQLVTLGESMLSITRDITATVREQMAAGARFQAIVRQLNLPMRKVFEAADRLPVAVNDTPARATNPLVKRRTTTDPRRGLMAVK